MIRLGNLHRASASLSIRAYQGLLHAYPSRFRREYGSQMAQVFRTACRETYGHDGIKGLIRLWRHILPDLLISSIEEWRVEMRSRNWIPLAASAVLLFPALIFLTLVFFGYALDVSSIRQPFDSFYTDATSKGWSRVADVFVLGGSVIVVLINAFPFLRTLRVQFEGHGIASITLSRVNLISVAILLVGLGLIAIFGAYFLTENWQCIIGAKLSC
jgi:hypothetical protein